MMFCLSQYSLENIPSYRELAKEQTIKQAWHVIDSILKQQVISNFSDLVNMTVCCSSLLCGAHNLLTPPVPLRVPGCLHIVGTHSPGRSQAMTECGRAIKQAPLARHELLQELTLEVKVALAKTFLKLGFYYLNFFFFTLSSIFLLPFCKCQTCIMV